MNLRFLSFFAWLAACGMMTWASQSHAAESLFETEPDLSDPVILQSGLGDCGTANLQSAKRNLGFSARLDWMPTDLAQDTESVAGFVRLLCLARHQSSLGKRDEFLAENLVAALMKTERSDSAARQLLMFEAVDILTQLGERNRALHLLDRSSAELKSPDMRFRATMIRLMTAMLPAYSAQALSSLESDLEQHAAQANSENAFATESLLIGWQFVGHGYRTIGDNAATERAYKRLAASVDPRSIHHRRYAVGAYKELARTAFSAGDFATAERNLQIARRAATYAIEDSREAIGTLDAGIEFLKTRIRRKQGASLSELFPGSVMGDPEHPFLADWALQFDGTSQDEREQMVTLYRDLYEERGLADITAGPAIPDIPQLLALAFEQAQSLFASKADSSVVFASALRQAESDEVRKQIRQLDESRTKRRYLLRRYLDSGPNPDPAALGNLASALDQAETTISDLDDIAWMLEEVGSQPERWNSILPWYLAFRQSFHENLGEDFLLVVPADGDIHVFVQGHKSDMAFAWHRLEDGVALVKPLVERLRCQMDPKSSCTAEAQTSLDQIALTPMELEGQAGFDFQAAYQLYTLLIEPVEAALAPGSDVFVMARGKLSTLPLAMLVTRDPAEVSDWADYDAMRNVSWLGDRYAFSSVPSFESFRPNRFREIASISEDMVFAVVNPLFEGVALPGELRSADFLENGPNGALANLDVVRQLAPLPGTQREYEDIVAALGLPQTALIGADANEASLRGHPDLGKSRYILFATHGLLPRENSLDLREPALVLTPPHKASVENDGLLTASEVLQLDLQADWVILSACNTAAGSGEGESLSKLASAFLRAGALKVLASHWPVGDKVTPALTTITLQYSAEHPSRGPARALAAALVAVRSGLHADGGAVNGWKAEWAHPRSWAPFVVISNGDEAIVNNRFELEGLAN